jgi:tight adherence protein B
MLRASAAGLIVAISYIIVQRMPGLANIARLTEPALKYVYRRFEPVLRGIREKKRTREIEEELPVFLRQTASCLEASLTVRQAIKEGAITVAGPLGDELKAVNRELDSGISLDDALAGLAARVNIREVIMTAAVLKAGARYGGNISGAAQALSSIVRKRQAARRETNVLTAQARYSSLILSALPVAFFLFFPAGDGRGPLGALSTPAGWLVVMAGLGLNVGGFIVMRKLAGHGIS